MYFFIFFNQEKPFNQPTESRKVALIRLLILENRQIYLDVDIVYLQQDWQFLV